MYALVYVDIEQNTYKQGNKTPASLCIGADISKFFKIFEKF